MVFVDAAGSEARFAAYVEGLASVIGHKDRIGPPLLHGADAARVSARA